ncbi:MAG: sulfatase [Candidatus Hydrogenedentes bacterium]|nr:sulfatase [Candidatus Hydrogenedentota bacterium]
MRSISFSRRRFLGVTAGGCISLALGKRADASRVPNVIFAFSDEHRWQSMPFTEMPEVRAPNMERIAREGTEFTHCISNYPVCTPYRAMLLTGRWPYRTGMIDNNLQLRPEEETIAKAFKAAGYRTGYIGKWHLGGLRAEPFGFDTSLIWTGSKGHSQSKCHVADGPPVEMKGYAPPLMTDQALTFMDQERDKPFFLMLSWIPPHSPFRDVPDEFKAMYPKGSLPRRPNVPEAIAKEGVEGPIWGNNGWEDFQGYNAHITAIDRELGRLLEALEKKGLADNTILVYSSDHGSMFGSHGVGSKRQPYEESIRVPFLVRAPGRVPAGKKVDALFGAIDIMPTLCGMAGVDAPTGLDGQDFSPWMRGESGPDPESAFIMHISKKNASGGDEHPAPLFRGLRTKQHTFAVLGEGGGLLFDNTADPYQMKNLFGDPAHEPKREQLKGMLRDWLARAVDPYEL